MGIYWQRGVLLVAVFIALIIALLFTIEPVECVSVGCFQTNMIICSSATFINEEEDASWFYEIEGNRGELCDVGVTLLGAKEGSLELRQYEGNSMVCTYDIGVFAYPEKNLDTCSGELKENLQSIIIDKLYEYIVDNVGEISEELEGI